MIGRTISHYQILAKLGEGGMGIVYQAEDLKLKRPVALKFLPPALTADSETKKRFIHEARTASSLQHSNICTIHDIDETDDGQVFIVMDCYQGMTLKERLAQGSMPTEEVVRIAVQIAAGLAEAHEKGIVHRDIKPANIMITDAGVVKILDFGLSKLAGHPGITRTGTTIGTPAYMAPEQAQGKESDCRTDIWSFGVVLFEMLSGRQPFAAEYDQAVLFSIVNEEPAEIGNFRADIPEHLIALCKQCLEKDKSNRPQSMVKVLEWLKTRESRSTKNVFSTPNRWKISKISMIFSLVLLILVSGWHIGTRFLRSGRSANQSVRIAVLPFQNQTGDKASDLPILIQSVIVGELLGVDELKIIDPYSLNTMIESSFAGFELKRETPFFHALRNLEIAFIINGAIVKTGDQYLIQSSITNLLNSEIIFTNSIAIENEDVLPILRNLAQKILYCFQIKILAYDQEKDLRPWLKTDSQNLSAIRAFIQASRYNYQRESELAERYLRQAIELDSAFISPRIWLISKLVEKDDLTEASLHYRQLVALQLRASPFEQVMIDWAGACIEQDSAKQARYLALALDYSPHNDILLFSLARLRYIMGDNQESIEALNDLIKLKTKFSPTYYLLGANYFQLERYKDARETLEGALVYKPVEPLIYSLLARLSIVDGDTAKALYYEKLYLNRISEQRMPLSKAYENLALQNHAHDRYDAAIGYFRLAIAADENRAEYHKGLADVLFEKGLADSAATEYSTALRLDPNDADSHYRLGRIFQQKNTADLAISHYRAYLQLDSSSTKSTMVRKFLSQLQPD